MLIGFVCASSCVVGTKVLQRTFEIAVRFQNQDAHEFYILIMQQKSFNVQVLQVLWGEDSGCFSGNLGNIPSQVASHLVLWC
jgi:hypothetical protein